jgi:hypothetical protein
MTAAGGAPAATRWIVIPREHGAWGLLLQPFLCAAILGRRWDWLFIPAAILVLTAFILREPLLILARQKWSWKERKRDSEIARRCLLWLLPVCAVFGALCLAFLPAAPFLTLAGIAIAITLAATWMALQNRQRSVALQVVSSLGLGSSAFLAALVAVRGLPEWSWILYGLLTLHAIAQILIVRTRLEMRAGAKTRAIARWSWAFQGVLGCVVIGAALSGTPWLAAPAAITILVSVFELTRLRSPGALSEPLRRVGFRALGASLAHSALSVAVLW